jgi:hypothetical protein
VQARDKGVRVRMAWEKIRAVVRMEWWMLSVEREGGGGEERRRWIQVVVAWNFFIELGEGEVEKWRMEVVRKRMSSRMVAVSGARPRVEEGSVKRVADKRRGESREGG